jgi:hypothetical protein
MYTLSFEKFVDPDYFPDDKIVLYVVREKENIYYVGISKTNVWYRWFGANGRMVKNVYDEWISYDSIGSHIIQNMPKSYKWDIDLWTVEESNQFLDSSSANLKDIESEMISAILPSINFIGNSRDYRNEYNGHKVDKYLEYIKSHQEKIVKQSEIRAEAKKIDFGESEFMAELPPEDDIPF